MKKLYILMASLALVVLSVALVYPKAHRWARAHVNYKTATEDHPLYCLSCHLSTQKTGLASWLINADYYSPFNIAVSKDGKKLYVVAEEGNALLVVNTQKEKVIRKIKVGEHPHSVVLNKDESKAYVSNQWSDNIYEIDLSTHKVTDTLKTGSGPAELALNTDGKFLYAVNSYTLICPYLTWRPGKRKKGWLRVTIPRVSEPPRMERYCMSPAGGLWQAIW